MKSRNNCTHFGDPNNIARETYRSEPKLAQAKYIPILINIRKQKIYPKNSTSIVTIIVR